MRGSTSSMPGTPLDAKGSAEIGSGEVIITKIRSEVDIVTARQGGRALAAGLGFGVVDQAFIATAVSELARNILRYAGSGEVRVESRIASRRSEIRVIASDQGPGIPDLEAAMTDGFSTSKGLGLGLPGIRRLMDDMLVETSPGGTTVTASKFAAAGG